MKVVILISVCQQGFSKSCPYTFPELFAELTCQEGIPARHFKGQLFRRSAVIPKARVRVRVGVSRSMVSMVIVSRVRAYS